LRVTLKNSPWRARWNQRGGAFLAAPENSVKENAVAICAGQDLREVDKTQDAGGATLSLGGLLETGKIVSRFLSVLIFTGNLLDQIDDASS
jgi:hypothetical protein